MTIKYLQELTVNKIKSGSFPLKQILQDSLYYPACNIDGELIRYGNMHFNHLRICSYVYADYAAGKEQITANLDSFLGYHLIATRELSPTDVGADKGFPIPEGIDLEDYRQYQDMWQAFGQWAVYERDDNYGDNHGPIRFSLLYLGAEGVAAYSGLYLSNNITPKGMAIIQPGHAFGFNWTNFTDPNGPLSITMKMGRSMPEFVFYGGYGLHSYNQLPWPGYEQIDRKDHYYPAVFDSAITVWRGSVIFLKVYDGKRASNYGITLQVMDNPRTSPHDYVEQVCVEFNGRSYEAQIRTYRHGDTLRGNTIKDLIFKNEWRPGDVMLCAFYNNVHNHIYRIIRLIYE